MAGRPLVVVALGGNALLRRGERADSERQARNVRAAAAAIANLVADHDLVITHGNGPQVGLLAREAALDSEVKPYPLDILGAESQGMIGYLLSQALNNALPGRRFAVLLTRVVVDRADTAFRKPTKPIGPVYTRAEAEQMRRRYGWNIAPDGEYYRRVVASPRPLQIVELDTIRLLLAAGVVPICAGGGGVPVVVHGGAFEGVEAVVDKDLSAALLARSVGADILLMLTDVDAVQTGWGTPQARVLTQVNPEQLNPADFAAGSMRPKIQAAIEFVSATGGRAAIGALQDAAAVLAGEAGTRITAAAQAALSR